MVLIGVIHSRHPLFLSPTDEGDRFYFTITTIISAWFVIQGNRAARIVIGCVFLLLSAINLLIILAYVRDASANSLEIGFWTSVLGTLGYSLLFSQSIRVFEQQG